MPVDVNLALCNGCPGASEPPCMRVCPGDLLYRGENGIRLRDPRRCWDCAACIKVCPREALAMYLPVSLGGRGARLKARALAGQTRWRCIYPDGKEEVFELPAVKQE
ncbi:4Fe-4S dicluster domain-containing protein [Calderihabitans maritimus]|uniref:Ferredoxin n=1 Tax=Calderihabitans maritimus TaxID=1246530 RepID=A0A1Z5HVX7_9FIRM|nr:4Fe-4S dicluster domain-containing protein [Calderihabitans maritimus]GAW93558.1 ferredoxin [Calderihabitans maritimus]